MRPSPWSLAALVLVAAGGGCASSYLAAADREGDRIAAEKMAVVDAFRSDLVDPTQEPGERARRDPPVEVPALVTLDDALRIATQHNRGFQSQRESYFLSALGLGLTRRDFLDWVWSGALSWSGSDGKSVELAETTTLALSGTHLLPTGGRVSVSTSGSIGSVGVDGDRDQDAAVSGTISFSQPLLRGAGNSIAFEGLTQAERSMVYTARSFEEFRQSFAISVISQYYNLVDQKKSVDNIRNRVEAQQFLVKQAQSLYKLEMTTQQDVLRAEREYRDAQNSLLDAEQAYALALDSFKVFLGLPLDVEFDVGDEIPEPALLTVDPGAAVAAALENRLDIATQRDRLEDAQRAVLIAKNALLPDLSLDASFTVGSFESTSFDDLDFESRTGSFGVSLEIPLDRKAQRNSYRSSLIALDQARRGLEEAEDNVVLEIRNSIRSLEQVRQQIENDRAQIETLRRLVRKANIDSRAGLSNNRDVTEAVNQLTDALNSLNGRYVSYYLSRLRLLQQMGLLFVDKEGKVVP